jgi:hypothetical protein
MKCKFLALMYVGCLLFSSYVMIIPSIELFFRQSLIDSLLLFDRLGSTPTMEFQVSDTLILVAKVRYAKLYSLVVNDKGGKVFSRFGLAPFSDP